MTAFDSSSSGFCTNYCSVVREGCFDLQDSFSGPLPNLIANQKGFPRAGSRPRLRLLWCKAIYVGVTATRRPQGEGLATEAQTFVCRRLWCLQGGRRLGTEHASVP